MKTKRLTYNLFNGSRIGHLLFLFNLILFPELSPAQCLSNGSADCEFCNSEIITVVDSSVSCPIPVDAMRFCYGPQSYNWFDLYGVDQEATDPVKTPIFIFAHANGGTADGGFACELWQKFKYDSNGFAYPPEEQVKLLSWESSPQVISLAESFRAEYDLETILTWIADPAVQDQYGIDIDQVYICGRSRGVGLSWRVAYDVNSIVPIAGAIWLQGFSRNYWPLTRPHPEAAPGMPPTLFVFDTMLEGCNGHKPEHGMLISHYYSKHSKSWVWYNQTDLTLYIRDFVRGTFEASQVEPICGSNNLCFAEGDYQNDICVNNQCQSIGSCTNNGSGWEMEYLMLTPTNVTGQIASCEEEEQKISLSWDLLRYWEYPPFDTAAVSIDRIYLRFGKVYQDGAAPGGEPLYTFENIVEGILENPAYVDEGETSSLEIDLETFCSVFETPPIFEAGETYGIQIRFSFVSPYNAFSTTNIVEDPFRLITPWSHYSSYVNLDLPSSNFSIPGMIHNDIVFEIPGCIESCSSLIGVEAHGLANLLNERIKIYSNPALDQVAVAIPFNSQSMQVSLLSLEGKMIASNVYSVVQKHEISKFNVRGIPSGFYLLNVVTDSGAVTKKLMVGN